MKRSINRTHRESSTRQAHFSKSLSSPIETSVTVDAQHLQTISLSFSARLQKVTYPQLGSHEADLLNFFQECRTEISLSEIKRQGWKTSIGKLCQPKNPPETVRQLRRKGWVIQLDEREDDYYYSFLGPATDFHIDKIKAFIKRPKNPWVYPQFKNKL